MKMYASVYALLHHIGFWAALPALSNKWWWNVDNFTLLRSQSIVNVVGKIKVSEQQITLEGNHSVCNLEDTQHKWYDLM